MILTQDLVARMNQAKERTGTGKLYGLIHHITRMLKQIMVNSF